MSAWKRSTIGGSSVRKVTGGFLVFCLLLGEESGKSDDLGVDGFRTTGARVGLVVRRHCWVSSIDLVGRCKR
jgi:hypothetical protein